MVRYSILLLAFVCVAAPAVPYASAQNAERGRDGALALELAKLRLLNEQGRTKEALALAQELLKQHPGDKVLLGAAAQTNYGAGYHRAALKLAEQAIEKGNKEVSTLELKKALERTLGPKVGGQYTYRSSDLDTFRISRAFGETPLPGYDYERQLRLGASVEHLSASLGSAIEALGNEEIDEDRTRGELYGIKSYGDRHQARAGLFFGHGSVGGGAAYRFNSGTYVGSLFLELEKPNWDYVEEIANEGTRHQVGLGYERRLLSALYFSGEGALRRYDLEDATDAASTGFVRLNLHYLAYSKEAFNLTAGYSIEAEYLLDEDRIELDGGGEINPLAFSSREYHIGQLDAEYDLTKALAFRAFGGYAQDRIGEGSPLYGVALTYDGAEALRMELLAAQRFSFAGEDDSEEQYIVNAAYRF